MRRVLRLALPLAASAAAATSCIPSRDNEHDPKNALRASLVVYVGTSGGTNLGNRHDVFTLDASGTVDPRERTLTYDWDIDGAPGFELLADDVLTCSATTPPPCLDDCGAAEGLDCLRTTLSITSGALPGGVGTAELVVGARVHAGSKKETATAIAAVTNEAPIVDVGGDIFVPDLTGGLVVLDACAGRVGACTSRDPDGDDLDWTWTPLRGDFDGFLPASNDTRLFFIAPAAEQTLLFEAKATDGVAERTALVRVHVGSQAWLTTFDPTLVWRIYADLRPLHTFRPDYVNGPAMPPESYTPDGGIIADDAGNVWVGVAFSTTSSLLDRGIVYGFTPNLEGLSPDPLQEWSHPGAFVPTALALVGTNLCATLRTHTDATGSSFMPPSFFAWLERGAALDPGDSADELFEEPKYVQPRNASSCWAVTGALPSAPDGASVYTFGAGGTTSLVEADALDDVTSSTSDGAGGLWITGPGQGCSGSAFLRYTPSSIEGAFAGCHSHRVDSIVLHPDGGLWLHDAETQEIYWLTPDGDILLTDAPLIGLPGDEFFPRGEPRMASDLVARDLWLVDVNLRRIGRLTESEGSFVDSGFVETTEVRFSTSGGFGRVRTLALLPRFGRVVWPISEPGNGGALVNVPAHMRVIERSIVSAPFVNISPEPTRGDVWIADQGVTLPSLRRLTPAGDLQVGVAIGAARGVASTADGGAWVALQLGTAGRLTRVTRDGDVVGFKDYPRPIVLISVEPSDESVCAVSDDGAGTVDILRIDAAGNLSAVSAGFGVERAAKATPGGCWFLFADDGVVFYDGTNAVIVDQSGDPFAGPYQGDVDYDGSIWFVGNPQFAYRGIAGGAAALQLPNFPFDPVALNIQRRCLPGTCIEESPLLVWVATGTSLHRLNGSGDILQSYAIPFVGNITALDVLP